MRAGRDLDAAGITDPATRAGYLVARASAVRPGLGGLRRQTSTGWTIRAATLLLPPARRPYVWALAGFARHAGSFAHEDPHRPPAPRLERLEDWRSQLLTDLEWGASSDPLTRALLDTVARWSLPINYLSAILDAAAADLTTTSYATWDDLAAHLWGSAAVPGLAALPILGRRDEDVRWDVLETHAISLSTAVGLTCLLGDVGTDLRRGHLYLPLESLDRFDVDATRLARGVMDESIRNLVAWEMERARRLHADAAPGVDLVAAASRSSVEEVLRSSAGLLDDIETADYDVLSGRVPGGPRRLARVTVGAGWRSIVARRADRTRPTDTTSS